MNNIFKLFTILWLSTFVLQAQDITNKLGGDTDAVKYDVTDSADKVLLRVQGDGKVGIGTDAPDKELHIAGNIKMVDGNQGVGKILTSDTNGVGTWQTASLDWSLSGNVGTTAGTNFIGTTDNKALEFKVNNQRVMRYEPRATSPNVIGGYSGNSTSATIVGAFIGGGGRGNYINQVTASWGSVLGGASNTASGQYSTAMGQNTTASGEVSTAMGITTTASGKGSTAMGAGTIASGFYSTALGEGTKATFKSSTVVGQYNEEDSDALFIVGDGTSTSRRNAFEVDDDGDAWVRDNLTVGDNVYADKVYASDLYTKFGVSGDPSRKLISYTFVLGGTGVSYTPSDQNLKEHIQTISSPIEKLSLLRGVTYDWNQKAKNYFTKDVRENVLPDDSLSTAEKEAVWKEERQKILEEANRHTMSFIAQEVEEVFPEWVKENEDGYKEINMKGLDGLLVEAVKELKSEKDLEITALNSTIEQLLIRIEKLENQ